ncbi:peptidase [Nitrosopumilus ureiphilus]|uniref:Peptidase n=1 Tax=Nitrosopumilus ureiphilus TaxID=1470067 RepID=A0A7D5RA96_9ARCH|nr:peptidase [Nitrosopumilus ureiphilus]QLH06244.1 peptidase [Nitrosopumilus ureiphilus]
MKGSLLIIPLFAALLLGSLSLPSAFAQFQSGGVDKEGSWYAGEGLKKGDFFSYSMCHVDYKECTKFEMDMWIKGDKQVGSETKWLAEVVVYDGDKRVVGEMELGKIAPEPTGGSIELGVYRGAFKSSVVWLSAFATSDASSGGKGPKEFKATSWGKIGNIGGEQVLPKAIETITVPAGTWETVQMYWKTGGVGSKVWIVDDFPFPIKAKTYTHVSEGIPPTEYEFTLLEYRENVQTSPFEGIISTEDEFAAAGCETNFEKSVSVKKPTTEFTYQVHVFYGPEDPVVGCEMQWLVSFISKFDDTEYLNQVQYDLLVVDKNSNPIRSLAQEESKQYLYSPSGQALLDFIIKEKPGTANYVIWIYGLAPEGVVPNPSKSPSDFLKIPVQIYAPDGTTVQKIPDWIKNNAGWWADGSIDDNSFVQGIQFLIKEGIMKIPQTPQGSDGSAKNIPSWIKNNAGWWADGSIDDNSFVQGIQFLIKEGIMKIPQTPKKPTGYQPESLFD